MPEIPAHAFCFLGDKGCIGGDNYPKGGEKMKREEKEEPGNWEIKDPKPPVVRSGHLEERKR